MSTCYLWSIQAARPWMFLSRRIHDKSNRTRVIYSKGIPRPFWRQTRQLCTAEYLSIPFKYHIFFVVGLYEMVDHFARISQYSIISVLIRLLDCRSRRKFKAAAAKFPKKTCKSLITALSWIWIRVPCAFELPLKVYYRQRIKCVEDVRFHEHQKWFCPLRDNFCALVFVLQ